MFGRRGPRQLLQVPCDEPEFDGTWVQEFSAATRDGLCWGGVLSEEAAEKYAKTIGGHVVTRYRTPWRSRDE